MFENDLIQIGVKSEFRQNLGRLGLFYGNKTQVALQVSCTMPVASNLFGKAYNICFIFLCLFWFYSQNFLPVLSWSAEDSLKLNVQIKPVEPTLEAGAQIQQMLTAECIDDYAGKLKKRKHKNNN